MKSTLFSIFLIVLFSCCKKDKSAVVYYCKSTVLDYEIRGNSLYRFFEQNNDLIKVEKIKLNDSKEFIHKLNYLKNQLEISDYKDSFGMSTYHFAFLFENDTLYSDSELISWKHKDKLLHVQDEDLITYLSSVIFQKAECNN